MPQPPRPKSWKPRPDARRTGGAARPYQPRRPAHATPAPIGDGRVWLFGLHAVRAAWENEERVIHRLLATENALQSFGPPAAPEGVERPAAQLAERGQIDRLLPEGAVHQGLAIEVDPLPEVDLSDLLVEVQLAGDADPALFVVLDQVTDPHNVGAVLRSAAAFGARAVILARRYAPEATGTLAKSASGALDVVPLVRVTNLSAAIEELQSVGVFCAGFAEAGDAMEGNARFAGPTALVFGAEGKGLREKTMTTCDVLLRLPTQGAIGSLNVSNAAAVALYEARRQRLVR